MLQEISVHDPWDARSLEWATHIPVPEYNFAITSTSKLKGSILGC